VLVGLATSRPALAQVPPAAAPAQPADATPFEKHTRATAEKLAAVVPRSLRFEGVSPIDAADFLRDVTGVTIFVDARSLTKAGVDLGRAIDLSRDKLTLEDALVQTFQRPAGAAAKPDAKVVAKAVGNLVVVSTEAGARALHDQLAADAAVADAAVAAGSDALTRALPEIAFSDVPLPDCVDFLGDVSGKPLLVDWKSLEDAGIPRSASVSMTVSRLRVYEAIRLILHSLNVRDRPIGISVDPNTARILIAAKAP
jgi:hypothetical protein